MTIPATIGIDAASRRRWDAVVVGAGPAGAIAARQLARGGVSVLLVDRQQLPRAKVCGGCLGTGAMELLGGIGLGELVPRLGGIPLHSFRVAGWSNSATLAIAGGASISRWTFDAALAGAAINAGAEFVPGVQAKLAPARDGNRPVRLAVIGGTTEVAASVVIAADGLGSGLLAAADPTVAPAAAGSRIGAAAIVEDPSSSYRAGTVYMAVGTGGYVGLVRLEDGRLNVAAALDKEGVRDAGSPAAAAARILEEATMPAIDNLAAADWKGTRRLTRRTAPLAGERVLAVGDASGYIEPFTGEGIGWAMAAAVRVEEFAKRAIDGWDPEIGIDWREAHRRAIGRSQRLCRGLAWLLRRPVAARVALRLLARSPSLGSPLVRRLQTVGRQTCEVPR